MATTRRPTGWVVRKPPTAPRVEGWEPMRRRPTKNEVVYTDRAAAQVRADHLNGGGV